MSQDVFLKFEYGPSDVLFGLRLRAVAWCRREPARAALRVGCVGVAVALYVVAPFWARRIAQWLVAIALVNAAFSVVWRVPYLMFRENAAALRKKVGKDAWSRKMTIDASDDGVTVTVGARSGSLKWEEVRSVDHDGRSYVLHTAAGFLVVPRRAFRNEAKDLAFAALASRVSG